MTIHQLREKYDLQTSNGKSSNRYYEWKSTKLSLYGNKNLIVETATKSLIEFCDFLDFNKIPYSLFFGTLLGIYRDGKLIEYDADMDIFIDSNYLNKFIESIPNLIRKDYELLDIGEYDNYNKSAKDYKLCFAKNFDRIDVFFFRKYKGFLNENYRLGKWKFKTELVDGLKTINALDYNFKIPIHTEKLLKFMYGKKWRTPIQGKHCKPGGIKTNIKSFKKTLGYIKQRLLKTLNYLIRR